MALDMIQVARALTAIKCSGVQITNPCNSSLTYMIASFSSPSWGEAVSVSPLQTVTVTPPSRVTDYSVVVYQVPPGCSPYQQFFQNDPTTPPYPLPITPCHQC